MLPCLVARVTSPLPSGRAKLTNDIVELSTRFNRSKTIQTCPVDELALGGAKVRRFLPFRLLVISDDSSRETGRLTRSVPGDDFLQPGTAIADTGQLAAAEPARDLRPVEELRIEFEPGHDHDSTCLSERSMPFSRRGIMLDRALRPPERRLAPSSPATNERIVDWVVPNLIVLLLLVVSLVTLPKGTGGLS